MTTHHVLDCGAAADFQSFFEVMHAELIAELLRLSKKKYSFSLFYFDHLRHVMLATSSSLSSLH